MDSITQLVKHGLDKYGLTPWLFPLYEDASFYRGKSLGRRLNLDPIGSGSNLVPRACPFWERDCSGSEDSEYQVIYWLVKLYMLV